MEDYDYDANGNRTNNGFVTAAGKHNRISTDGAFVYTFDEQGNRLTRVRTSGRVALVNG